MSQITLITYLNSGAAFAHSHVTDLALVLVNGRQVLYSTTDGSGVLSSWNIDGTTPANIDSQAFDGTLQAGSVANLSVLNDDGIVTLFSGGGTQSAPQIITLDSNGAFNLDTAVSVEQLTGYQHFTTVDLGTSRFAVYGGLVGADGLGQITFDRSGTISAQTTTAGIAGTYTDQISATTTTAIDGQNFLLTASMTGNGVTSWSIDQTGALSAVDNLGTDQELWIDVPTVMTTTVVNGQTYVLLGAAGSDSISVMQLNPDGNMILRDHVLDGLETRFGGISALEVINHNGQTFVIAGGADDGISVFILLEGGQLLPRGHIADTTEMGLDNISALAVNGHGNGLDIYVASSSEIGITKLRFSTGPAGVTATATLAGGVLLGSDGGDILQGQLGNDVIFGGAGDDILRDGRGSDTLTGGAGADVFILSADGATDTITDFSLGEDTIDLSLWPMLRDASQLTMTMLTNGVQVSYGEEVLIVQSVDGRPIDYRDFTNADLIGITRIPQTVTPGYPGPYTPPPDLDPPTVDNDDPAVINPVTGIGVITTGNLNELRDAMGGHADTSAGYAPVIIGQDTDDNLNGDVANDVIIGGGGNDIISGEDGNDTLLGRSGSDTLFGGVGADILFGGAGADTLNGGTGQDILRGGAGNDVIDGGAGNDILFGDAGADEFIFNGGIDTISDFTQGEDHITLSPDLWTGLTSVDDLLLVYGHLDGSQMTIDFGGGDALVIEDVTDPSALADDIALF
ncbi:putative secreted protein (type I secretion substrate) [Yoonia maritima]|uniref:Putative secreted protein (Type I secretion substrate) n=1 Tax=Yoonia maritima TaxID=1435347 RepID=A0A2T0VW10_9RHOB|nr:calcium-binding protein [Yoonia maritima]PRY75987.1 putative secreted protein (type I secretion substrate) [Yoonia maritima]